MENQFYITTAIDYINAKPHIGHAYEKVAVDVLARYYAGKLGKDKVRFLTGTDEHGAKIAKAAESAGMPIQDFANETAAKFSFAWDQFNIVPDRFIRTTDQDHIVMVQSIVTNIKENGYAYEGEYEGWYCTSCETFYTETDAPDHMCPVHKSQLELIKEKNWFLKISSFSEVIKNKIISGELEIWPESAKSEIVSMLEHGFNDIAISRPNVAWGVPLPWDSAQTIYVWVDALINYVTGSTDEHGHNFWPANAHVVGKDIAKFHCIIWPALLLASGFDLPKKVVVHGYLTVGGEKMSKTTGNVIDPNDWVSKYGADAVRYLLMREVAFGSDGDISEEKLKSRFDGELANGLGNLVSRVTTLIEKYLNGVIPESAVGAFNFDKSECDVLIEQYRFHDALAKIWEWVAWANKTVDEKKLWELGKTDLQDFANTSKSLVMAITQIATSVKPFMPETSEKILQVILKEKIVKAEPLFPKSK